MARRPRKVTKKVAVAVTVGNGSYDRTHTFRMTRDKLPSSFNVEGLMLTVREKGNPPSKAPGNEKPAPRGAIRKRSIEIVLPPATPRSKTGLPTWMTYGALHIPRDVRSFFPPYKVDFVVRTSKGDFIMNIASANNHESDRYRGSYFSKGSKKFFTKAHTNLGVGDTLVFKKAGTVTIDGEKYKLYTMKVKK